MTRAGSLMRWNAGLLDRLKDAAIYMALFLVIDLIFRSPIEFDPYFYFFVGYMAGWSEGRSWLSKKTLELMGRGEDGR